MDLRIIKTHKTINYFTILLFFFGQFHFTESFGKKADDVIDLTSWLVSPNGGEAIWFGSTVQLNTTLFNPSGGIAIEIYKGSTRIGGPSIGGMTNRSITTSGLVPGSDYKIHVFLTGSSPLQEDWSDGYFSIVAPPDFSNWLTYPNGGEVMGIGSILPVKVDASRYPSNNPAVVVELYKGSTKIWGPSYGGPTDRSYTTTGLASGSDYKIHVYLNGSNPLLEDWSDGTFSILSGAPIIGNCPSPSVWSSGVACRIGTQLVLTAFTNNVCGKTVSHNWYTSVGDLSTVSHTDTNAGSCALLYSTVTVTNPQTYWVSAVIDGCESARVPVTASYQGVGNPASSPVARCGSGPATLTATPASNANSVRWYTTPSNSSETSFATGNSYTTPTLSATTTYYITSYNTTTHCESPRVPVTVTVNPMTDPPIGHDNFSCGSGVVTLTANAIGNPTIRWYNTLSSTTVLSTGPVFTTPYQQGPNTYYSTAYNSTTGCESGRTAVNVIIKSIPKAPTTISATGCSAVAQVVLNAMSDDNICGKPGSHIWYTTATESNFLTNTNSYAPVCTILNSSVTVAYPVTYWVSSVVDGCESARTSVTAAYQTVGSPTGSGAVLCDPGTATLTATPGSNANSIGWYTTPAPPAGVIERTSVTGTSFTTPTLNAETTYYITSYNTTTRCESATRVPITVTFPIHPSPPIASNIPIHYNTIATLIASGAGPGEMYKWYDGNNVYLGQGWSYTTSPLTQNTPFMVSKFSLCESGHTQFQVIVNQPPIVNAGVDQTTGLTAYNFYGSATDPEGSSLSYSWSQVSGPSTSTLINPATSALFVSNLVAGIYVFRLTVSDILGDAGTDDVTLTVTSTSNNYNYVREDIINVPNILNISQVEPLAIGSKWESTVYANGMGQTMLSVSTQGSPQRKDVLVPITYDEVGRKAKSYLPYATTQTSGGFISQVISNDVNDPSNESKYAGSPHQQFYQNFSDNIDKVANDPVPYSQTIFEASPMNRPRVECSPGQVYSAAGEGSLRRNNFGTNTPNEVRRWIVSNGSLLSSSGSYDPGVLKLVTTTNEEGIKTSIFYNSNGFKVVEKNQTSSSPSGWAETYYVYDAYNNLRFVLPPEFVKLYPTGAGPLSTNQTDVDKWCYQFNYDNENRLIQKKTPGIDWVYSVYDSRDRIVLIQDGNQRINNEWSYIKYEEFNRPVIYGIHRPGSAITQATMQNTVNGLNGGLGYENVTIDVSGNSTGAFPNANEESLVKIYYDNYQTCDICNDANYQFVPETWGNTSAGSAITSNDPQAFVMVSNEKTKAIASSVKVLGGSTWLNTVTYYNYNGQPIQSIISNHLGGRDRISLLYDFSGKQIASLRSAIGYNNGGVSTIRKHFDYDHAGRLLNTYHRINSQPEIIMAAYEYNEIGQIVKKKIHGVGTTPTFLQALDFRYTIQGALSVVNNNTTPDSADPATDYFSMGLTYAASLAGNTPRKDGLVSSFEWKHDLSTKQRNYNYSYTDRGQLKDSKYKMSSDNGSTWVGEPDFFNEEGLTYDLNGNIKTLNRKSEFFDGSTWMADQVDALTYDYSAYGGNLLSKVSEGSASSNKQIGFKDGVNTGNDYAYDPNGNVTIDQNKGITSISYFVNNLPNKITFADGSYLQNTYDASGIKLSQVYFNHANSQTVTTDYVRGFVLLNGQVLLMNEECGRIVAPTYSNLVVNREANSLDGFTASESVALSTQYINSQTYVTATCNQTTGRPGVFPIRTTKGDTYTVTPGESYSFKVLGYQSVGSTASLYVWTNTGDIIWPGTVLPQGQSNENWVTSTFTIPIGVTQIKLGVLWNGPANGNSIFINRVALYKTDYEYQYFLSDHLGSPRVVLQTNPNTITYTATMETENVSTEDMVTYPATGQFQNLNNVSQRFVFAPGNSTPGGDEVIRMNASLKVGPSKSLKVYPGDKIDASVFSYFPAGGTYSKTPAGVIATLVAGTLGGVSGAPGDPGSMFSGVTGAYGGAFGLSPDQGTTSPSAFLNYILFDKDFKPLGGKSVPVPTTAAGALQMIQIPQISVLEPGYVYVYLSYDNSTGNDVYFDDLKIVQTESPVIQVNSYYPYGMVAYSWLRAGETDNANLYQGKELIAQTGWHDFGSRMYWSDLGRWFGDDPQTQSASPFMAMNNNPSLFMDPNGEKACKGLIIAAEVIVLIVVAVLTDGVGDAIVGPELLGSELAADVAAGAIEGAITGAVVGGSNSLIEGNSLDSKQFRKDVGWGALAGAVTGGVSGGAESEVFEVGKDATVFGRVLNTAAKGAVKGAVGGFAEGFANEMRSPDGGDATKAFHAGIVDAITGAEFGGVAGAAEGLFKGLRISSGQAKLDKNLKRHENVFVTYRKSRTAGANGALQGVSAIRLFNVRFYHGNMVGMGIGKAVEGSKSLFAEKMLIHLRQKWNLVEE